MRLCLAILLVMALVPPLHAEAVAPAVSAQEVAKVRASLSKEQLAMLEDMCDGAIEQGLANSKKEAMELVLNELAATPEAQRAQLLRQLPDIAAAQKADREQKKEEGKRQAAAVKTLSGESKAAIALLASDDTQQALSARLNLIRLAEPGIPAAITEKAKQYPEGSLLRLRFDAIAHELTRASLHERGIMLIDPPMRRAEAYSREHPSELAVAIIARESLERAGYRYGGSVDLGFSGLCYYSFPERCHGYGTIPVSLEYGNGGGRLFSVNMYGGQENEIIDLGATPHLPKTWDEATQLAIAKPIDDAILAIAGHLYAEHCCEPAKNIDQFVLFKVVAVDKDSVIIAWAPNSTAKP
jgi:hypothetical protein